VGLTYSVDARLRQIPLIARTVKFSLFLSFFIVMEAEEIHIGSVIRKELKRQGRSVSWLAKQLFCDRSNIYRMFQKASLETSLLFRISKILGTDFFVYFSRKLPEHFSCFPERSEGS